jgi:hypothetical protein
MELIMRRIHILGQDICGGHSDLTIVPCSGKMKKVEKPRNQERIETYGLPTPHDLRDEFGFGKVSPIFSPTKNVGKIKYFAFAASVLNQSDILAIQNIGEQIGTITRNNEDIRLVETPFLGCGDGGLYPSVAMPALAKGFLATSHPDAILQLCSDSASSVIAARGAIEELLEKLDKARPTQKKMDVKRVKPRKQIKYDFVLSFAGEQRKFVEQISSQLKAANARVFYDNDEEVELWGENLYDYLYEVYSKQSRYCVIFVSKEYNKKEWTTHERKAAQERAFREKNNAYILPIRIDGANLLSLSSTLGYIESKLGSERIVEMLLRKLNVDHGP